MRKSRGARQRKAEAPKDLPVRKTGEVVGGTLTAMSGIKVDFSEGTSGAPAKSATTTSTTAAPSGPIRTRSGIVMEFED